MQQRFLIFSRSAGPLGCHTRIRAGFPRARPRAPVTVVREHQVKNHIKDLKALRLLFIPLIYRH